MESGAPLKRSLTPIWQTKTKRRANTENDDLAATLEERKDSIAEVVQSGQFYCPHLTLDDKRAKLNFSTTTSLNSSIALAMTYSRC